MGERIEAEPSRHFGEGVFLSDQLFRLIYLQPQISLVNAHARLFAEESAQVRFAVMETCAQVVQLESVVQFLR